MALRTDERIDEDVEITLFAEWASERNGTERGALTRETMRWSPGSSRKRARSGSSQGNDEEAEDELSIEESQEEITEDQVVGPTELEEGLAKANGNSYVYA